MKKQFSVSKWIKHQVLLDEHEMEACLSEISPAYFYNVSSIVPRDKLQFSKEVFLHAYQNYISALKRGEVPKIDRPIFSSVITVDPEALFAEEIKPGGWMARLKTPVVQLQHHRFFVSKVDHKIHPMVMSPDSICWGVQFAFPQIFLDETGSYMKTTEFPNWELFSKLLKWVKAHSVPTTFLFQGIKIATPIRLGKNCFSWINTHPQLVTQGVQVYVY